MEDSQKDKVCNFKELRFKGRLYLGNDLIRTISMQTPPRVGDEILYHDRYDLPFERWLVKRIADMFDNIKKKHKSPVRNPTAFSFVVPGHYQRRNHYDDGCSC